MPGFSGHFFTGKSDKSDLTIRLLASEAEIKSVSNRLFLHGISEWQT